jgi:hypothetical protein
MADLNQELSSERKSNTLQTVARIIFLLAVAVIIFLLARSCSSNRSQLESTRAAMIRERDSLIGEFQKVQSSYITIIAEKELLNSELAKENELTRQLIAENAAKGILIAKSDARVAAQSERINSLTAKNDSLLAALNDLQNRMAELAMKIEGQEKELGSQKDNINNLNNLLSDKDVKLNDMTRSMDEQHFTDSMKLQPRFISAAEIIGGPGINVTSVPYSQYVVGGNVLFGMEFNRRFLGGIGAGAQVFNGGTLVPLFLEFRYGFPVKNFTPYIFSKGGPLLDFGSYSASNLFMNAGIGVRHQLSDNFAINFGTGLYSHNSGANTGGRNSFITVNAGIIYSKKNKDK